MQLPQIKNVFSVREFRIHPSLNLQQNTLVHLGISPDAMHKRPRCWLYLSFRVPKLWLLVFTLIFNDYIKRRDELLELTIQHTVVMEQGFSYIQELCFVA